MHLVENLSTQFSSFVKTCHATWQKIFFTDQKVQRVFQKPLPFFIAKKNHIKCKMSDLLFYQAQEKVAKWTFKMRK